MTKYTLDEVNDMYVDVLKEIGNVGSAELRRRLRLQEFLSGDAARRTYTFGPRKENSEAHVPGIFVFSFDSASCMRRNSDKTCWTF